MEEALCFGWIDSTRKKTASGFLAQRLTPRSRKSKWSELNKERVRRLTRLGLMTPHGEKCLPEMDPEAFRIDPDILEALQKDRAFIPISWPFPACTATCAWIPSRLRKTSRSCSIAAWKSS